MTYPGQIPALWLSTQWKYNYYQLWLKYYKNACWKIKSENFFSRKMWVFVSKIIISMLTEQTKKTFFHTLSDFVGTLRKDFQSCATENLLFTSCSIRYNLKRKWLRICLAWCDSNKTLSLSLKRHCLGSVVVAFTSTVPMVFGSALTLATIVLLVVVLACFNS